MHFGWQTRLARSSEIKRVFKAGKRHNCGVFLLIAAGRQTDPQTEHRTRACVVVSKKVSNRAVDRNLLKRRFRTLMRENQLMLPNNLDLVLIARKSMLQTSYQDLDVRFKKACAKLNAS